MSAELPGCHRYLNRIAASPLVPVQLAPELPPVWCKLEFLNPSGSTKDRIARFILEKAWRQGRVKCGDCVVEASSGSTSIALALACAQMGLKFLAVMPEGVSNERVFIIRAYGGDVRFTPAALGIRGAIAEVERLGQEGGRGLWEEPVSSSPSRSAVFLPKQFSNRDNAEAHRLGTAREILDQIPGGKVDAVVSGVGTGGTLVGLFEGLRENGCRVLPVLAKPINLVRTPEAECCSFSARIPGVADAISEIFRPERMPDLVTAEVRDEDALATTRELIRLGFPVGPSSGLNYRAAQDTLRRLNDPGAQVVTVFPDRMERYFTTELFKPFV